MDTYLDTGYLQLTGLTAPFLLAPRCLLTAGYPACAVPMFGPHIGRLRSMKRGASSPDREGLPPLPLWTLRPPLLTAMSATSRVACAERYGSGEN